MARASAVAQHSEQRHNFGKIKLASEYPDLLEIQIKSFKEFFH